MVSLQQGELMVAAAAAAGSSQCSSGRFQELQPRRAGVWHPKPTGLGDGKRGQCRTQSAPNQGACYRFSNEIGE
jgi:hypothetical protein